MQIKVETACKAMGWICRMKKDGYRLQKMGCTYRKQIKMAIVSKVMGRTYRMQNKIGWTYRMQIKMGWTYRMQKGWLPSAK